MVCDTSNSKSDVMSAAKPCGPLNVITTLLAKRARKSPPVTSSLSACRLAGTESWLSDVPSTQVWS